MPITPFHFGPGTLAKAVAPHYFSLRAFIVTQVVIDCETAWNLLRENERLHTVFHSYAGSVIPMGITAGLLLFYNRVALSTKRSEAILGRFQRNSSLIGILFGGWSHVFLDGFMHADLHPYYPLNEANPNLASISLASLHVLCLAAFVLAAIIAVVRAIIVWLSRKRRSA
jgi:hypothetical protein